MTRLCLLCKHPAHDDRPVGPGYLPHHYDPGDRRQLPPPSPRRPETGHRRRWDELPAHHDEYAP